MLDATNSTVELLQLRLSDISDRQGKPLPGSEKEFTELNEELGKNSDVRKKLLVILRSRGAGIEEPTRSPTIEPPNSFSGVDQLPPIISAQLSNNEQLINAGQGNKADLIQRQVDILNSAGLGRDQIREIILSRYGRR